MGIYLKSVKCEQKLLTGLLLNAKMRQLMSFIMRISREPERSDNAISGSSLSHYLLCTVVLYCHFTANCKCTNLTPTRVVKKLYSV